MQWAKKALWRDKEGKELSCASKTKLNASHRRQSLTVKEKPRDVSNAGTLLQGKCHFLAQHLNPG